MAFLFIDLLQHFHEVSRLTADAKVTWLPLKYFIHLMFGELNKL